MKSCNIRYIFQHTDKKSLEIIQNRNKKIKWLAWLQEDHVYEDICDKVSENVIDIFSWELYEKDKIVGMSIWTIK
jgi:hypothetical protein